MDKNTNIEVIELSKYETPIVKPSTFNSWTLFGDKNDYFKYINSCYKGSPTNAGIINGYASYLIGEGLYDVNSNSFVTKIISRDDATLLTKDFKTYGQCAIQIIWNNSTLAKDKKPVEIKYIPIRKIGLNVDDEGEVNGYWYCFDWEDHKYKPKFYSKFDGRWKGDLDIDTDPNVEILMIRRPTDEDFFATPDYEAGLVYANLEAELANSAISHVQNGFQGGALINCNGGVPPTEELKMMYKKKIVDSLTGTNNTNKVIVSFNENSEQAMTIDRIPVDELNSQYESFDERAERKLLIAHSAPSILFSGSREGGGLGSNSEEMIEATKSLFRRHIYPMRETILNSLQYVMDFINPDVELIFKDFEELNIKDDEEDTIA